MLSCSFQKLDYSLKWCLGLLFPAIRFSCLNLSFCTVVQYEIDSSLISIWIMLCVGLFACDGGKRRSSSERKWTCEMNLVSDFEGFSGGPYRVGCFVLLTDAVILDIIYRIEHKINFFYKILCLQTNQSKPFGFRFIV